MNWKDTVIKSDQIKWKRLPVKNIAGDKLDIQVNIPLTNLFESQARQSFLQGMFTMLQFHIQHQVDKRSIGFTDLIGLFNLCGLPEIATLLLEGGNDELTVTMENR